MTVAQLQERLSLLEGVAHDDIDTARNGPWHPAAGAGRILAVLQTEALADGDEAKVRIGKATTAGGANADTAVEATETMGADEDPVTVVAELEASDLGETSGGTRYTHVRVEIEVDTAGSTNPAGGAVLILGDRSYQP